MAERLGIRHHGRATLGHQLAGDVAEVEIDGAGQAGFAQRRRFQQVVTAHGHQAATDKGEIRRRQHQRQLAHGVTQVDLVLSPTALPAVRRTQP